MATKKRSSAASKKNEQQYANKELKAIILFAVALFVLAVVIIKGQNFWTKMHEFVFGVFGIASYLYPFLIGFFAIAIVADKRRKLMSKAIESSIFVVLLGAFSSVVVLDTSKNVSFGEQLFDAYDNGIKYKGGGFLGGLIGNPLCNGFGKAAAIVTLLILMFVFFMIVSGTTLAALYKAMSKPVKAVSKQAEEVYAERVSKSEENDGEKKTKLRILKGFDIDIPVDDNKPTQKDEYLDDNKQKLIDTYNDEEIESKKIEEPSKITQEDPLFAENPPEEEQPPLKKIKVDFEKETADVINEISTTKEIPHYKYPPFELLNKTNSSDVKVLSKELDLTAERLVEVLKSFGVETRVLDVSKGPTVTRYELQPCAGVKISKITGLADDIALNLATAGVRIEAPIPNKAAVGIERGERSLVLTCQMSVDIDPRMLAHTFKVQHHALPFDVLGRIK